MKPVAWVCFGVSGLAKKISADPGICKACGKQREPLYTMPPRLTDEEIDTIADSWWGYVSDDLLDKHRGYARAIEEKVRGEE